MYLTSPLHTGVKTIYPAHVHFYPKNESIHSFLSPLLLSLLLRIRKVEKKIDDERRVPPPFYDERSTAHTHTNIYTHTHTHTHVRKTNVRYFSCCCSNVWLFVGRQFFVSIPHMTPDSCGAGVPSIRLIHITKCTVATSNQSWGS